MTVDELNELPLPDGWTVTEVHQYALGAHRWRVTLTGPLEVRTESDVPGVHVLHGVTSTEAVHNMLRYYLPSRGVEYPADGQLAMDVPE